jgi:hypothetical protein
MSFSSSGRLSFQVCRAAPASSQCRPFSIFRKRLSGCNKMNFNGGRDARAPKENQILKEIFFILLQALRKSIRYTSNYIAIQQLDASMRENDTRKLKK